MMNYMQRLTADFRQLEDYARTCVRMHIGEPNGQGEKVNHILDLFMQGLLDGNWSYDDGKQIYLDDAMTFLLPQCRNAEKPQNTYLWYLVKDWIEDNCVKCEQCGEYLVADEIEKSDDGCWYCNEQCLIDHKKDEEADAEMRREIQSLRDER